MKPSIRLEETVCVGRLETLAQVLALLESLDDLDKRNTVAWVILTRQTRSKPEDRSETTRERSVLL